jgi:hypothetical protein
MPKELPEGAAKTTPGTDPVVADIAQRDATPRPRIEQQAAQELATKPPSPPAATSSAPAPKPPLTTWLSERPNVAVLEAGEFKVGDSHAVISSVAQRDISRLGTFLEETKGRLEATADKTFGTDFVQGLVMFKRHFVTTASNPTPELAYTELGYFRFSSPETGSRSYVVGRDLGFPKKLGMQPIRTEVISSLLEKYGKPSASLFCDYASDNDPKVRVLIYLYRGLRLVETDVPNFIPTSILNETIPKSNAWNTAFNSLLDVKAHSYIWSEFCLWPRRSDYKYGLSIPAFLASSLDQMYLVSILQGETDDYVGRIHTAIFDNDAYRSLTAADQKIIDKRHADRAAPTGVKAPL